MTTFASDPFAVGRSYMATLHRQNVKNGSKRTIEGFALEGSDTKPCELLRKPERLSSEKYYALLLVSWQCLFFFCNKFRLGKPSFALQTWVALCSPLLLNVGHAPGLALLAKQVAKTPLQLIHSAVSLYSSVTFTLQTWVA